jgi:hypothetical protein
MYVVSPANLENFGVPNDEKGSYAKLWISHFAESVSTASVAIFVDITPV